MKEGCYVLSSRDLPNKTESKNLVVTGHHWLLSDIIWRNNLKNRFIDRVKYSDFPNGPIENVIFSSCNSANMPYGSKDEGIITLMKKYPLLKYVQGWDGTAPLKEYVNKPFAPIKFFQRADKEGKKAWFYKKKGKWFWTDGRKTVEYK